MNVHQFLEKRAYSMEDKTKQDAKSFFRFMSMKDAVASRDALQGVLAKRQQTAKRGGVVGWFAKKSANSIKNDIKDFDRMIAYGRKNNIQ